MSAVRDLRQQALAGSADSSCHCPGLTRIRWAIIGGPGDQSEAGVRCRETCFRRTDPADERSTRSLCRHALKRTSQTNQEISAGPGTKQEKYETSKIQIG